MCIFSQHDSNKNIIQQNKINQNNLKREIHREKARINHRPTLATKNSNEVKFSYKLNINYCKQDLAVWPRPKDRGNDLFVFFIMT